MKSLFAAIIIAISAFSSVAHANVSEATCSDSQMKSYDLVMANGSIPSTLVRVNGLNVTLGAVTTSERKLVTTKEGTVLDVVVSVQHGQGFTYTTQVEQSNGFRIHAQLKTNAGVVIAQADNCHIVSQY